jgi:hypothetical protein
MEICSTNNSGGSMNEQPKKQSRTEELLTAILAEVKIITGHIQEQESERETQRRPIAIETAVRR